jgi:hypothetical protein
VKAVLRSCLVAAAVLALPPAAVAATGLAQYNGEWRGGGQDRDSPLQALQDTRCRSGVRATASRIRIDMVCRRRSGARKDVQISADLAGDEFTGRILQRTPRSGGPDRVLSGTLSGKKSDGSAYFVVDWEGMTPDAVVVLEMPDSETFSLRATVVGVTFLEASFRRISGASTRHHRRRQGSP